MRKENSALIEKLHLCSSQYSSLYFPLKSPSLHMPLFPHFFIVTAFQKLYYASHLLLRFKVELNDHNWVVRLHYTIPMGNVEEVRVHLTKTSVFM